MNQNEVWWKEYACEVVHSGSRVICDPPPEGSDDDWLCLVDAESLTFFEKRLKEDGFRIGGSLAYDGRNLRQLESFPALYEDGNKSAFFRSYKKDDSNIIVTCSTEYFYNFSKATDLCRWLNLRDKEDRIAVFEAVCFDRWPPSDGRSHRRRIRTRRKKLTRLEKFFESVPDEEVTISDEF